MPAIEPRHTLEEIARLGDEALERLALPATAPEDDGKFVAIDVATGEYEVDEDDYAAVMRLRGRRPTAEIWLGKIGERAAYWMRRAR